MDFYWHSDRFSQFVKEVGKTSDGATSYQVSFSFLPPGDHLTEKEKKFYIQKQVYQYKEDLRNDLISLSLREMFPDMLRGYIREYTTYLRILGHDKALTSAFVSNQHHVPDTYSQWFGDSIKNQSKEEKKKRIPKRLTLLSTKEYGLVTSSKLISHLDEKGKYDFIYGQELEQIFSVIEGDYSRIISLFLEKTFSSELETTGFSFKREALEALSLDPLSRIILSIFINTQYLRTEERYKEAQKGLNPLGENQNFIIDALIDGGVVLAEGDWKWEITSEPLPFSSDPVKLYYINKNSSKWQIAIGRHLLLTIYTYNKKRKAKPWNVNIAEASSVEQYFQNLEKDLYEKGLCLYSSPFDSAFTRFGNVIGNIKSAPSSSKPMYDLVSNYPQEKIWK